MIKSMAYGDTSPYDELIARFNEHKVKYIVVGGYAAQCHGYENNGDSFDIWIDKKERNLDKVVLALKQLHVEIGDQAKILLEDSAELDTRWGMVCFMTDASPGEFSAVYEYCEWFDNDSNEEFPVIELSLLNDMRQYTLSKPGNMPRQKTGKN
ncbi:hypothetical protein LVD17_00635 [Fulvivirga ulvae]|uniref:hypothetical protein n=1 Tax=Fulvivirga ulvae TaxID=2904245 RepID=UPI001F1C8FFB|nr:hypothetical protein [Fulvivirga ulvae]UII32344.1 hypothetical protein LVD17_00635 [Fulvivirga ulvae]